MAVPQLRREPKSSVLCQQTNVSGGLVVAMLVVVLVAVVEARGPRGNTKVDSRNARGSDRWRREVPEKKVERRRRRRLRRPPGWHFEGHCTSATEIPRSTGPQNRPRRKLPRRDDADGEARGRTGGAAAGAEK